MKPALQLNYARFEAKLEQRITGLRSEIVDRLTEFRDALAAKFESRFDRMEKRFDQQNRMFILGWVTLIAAVVALK